MYVLLKVTVMTVVGFTYNMYIHVHVRTYTCITKQFLIAKLKLRGKFKNAIAIIIHTLHTCVHVKVIIRYIVRTQSEKRKPYLKPVLRYCCTV